MTSQRGQTKPNRLSLSVASAFNQDMQFQVLLVATLAMLAAGVEVTEPPEIPQPYSFSYVAGRFPGHVDRTHSETSDGTGVVKGSFSYVDPRFEVRTVEYVADAQGFHPLVSSPPADTPAVAAAKQRHADLFARIAADHQRIAAQRLHDARLQPPCDDC